MPKTIKCFCIHLLLQGDEHARLVDLPKFNVQCPIQCEGFVWGEENIVR